jgi:hypothetical protein
MPAYQYPALACDDLMRPIEIQRSHGGASNSSQADHQQPIFAPAKMIVPVLGTRMIEIDNLAALGVSSLNLGALPLITLTARAPQIRALSWPTGCNRQDVLDAQRAVSRSSVRQ